MVHGLASQLGGALTIESRLGGGTNVEMWLPLSDHLPTSPEETPEDQSALSGKGTALLVDDEELARMSMISLPISELVEAVVSLVLICRSWG